jgi:hypothetical protein
MPSDRPLDPRVEAARDAMASAQRAFGAACEGALAQGEAWWNEQGATSDDRAVHTAAELGPFAAGRVDARRFGTLFTQPRELVPETLASLNRALDVLRHACARTTVTTVSIPQGGSLAVAVDDALAAAGRAFAAARVIDAVRGGRGITTLEDLEELPFRSWTRAERRYAPPLVVSVAGSDLHAAVLGDYADGRQKIVLVVDGPCAPAPLARLVTPGTLVVQTNDATALEPVARCEGPAVAAIVPEGAARFVHDPALGAEPWQRLSIQHLPSPPFSAVPGISAWQLREDVRQLEALAAAPAARPIPSGAGSADAPDAADRLTTWLLGQADFTGLA